MKKIFFLFIIFLMIGEAFAAAPLELSANKAIALALENSGSIKRSEITLKALERAKKHSWNSIAPYADLSASYDISDLWATSSHTLQGNFSAGIELPLSSFSEVKSGKKNYEEGLVAFELVRREIERQVQKLYFTILYQQAYCDLQEHNLETGRLTYEQNLKKYNEGRLSKIDVMTSKINVEKLKVSLKQAVIEKNQNIQSLKELLGLDLNSEIKLTDSLEESARKVFEDFEPGKLSENLKIRQLEKKIESLEAAAKMTKAQNLLPSLKAGVNLNPAKNFGGDEWTMTDSATVTLSFSFSNFFPFSKASDNIAAAKDAVKDARLELESEKKKLEIKKLSDIEKINLLKNQIESAKANIDLCLANYAMTKSAYEKGSKGILDLQNASDLVIQAQVSQLSDYLELISAVTDYKLGY